MFVVAAAFGLDAAVEIPVCGPAEEGSGAGRSILPAETADGCGAVLLLEPFGEGQGPEQPFGFGPVFGSGDLGEVGVLHGLDVFSTAAGVEVGDDFVPGGLLCVSGFGCVVAEPDEYAGRYGEQQKNQHRTNSHDRTVSGENDTSDGAFIMPLAGKFGSNGWIFGGYFGNPDSILIFANRAFAEKQMFMKSKLTLFALVILSVLTAVSCSKNSGGGSDEGGNSDTGSGSTTTVPRGWELTSWNGNTAIAGYVYLQFGDDGTFTLYQEIGDSSTSGYKKLTGTYVIEEGPDSKRIISGRYSDDTPWSDSYVIESWTETEIRWRSQKEDIVSIYTLADLPDYVTEPTVSMASRSLDASERFL